MKVGFDTVERSEDVERWTWPTLYKRDSKGKIREWMMQIEVVGPKAAHRTVSGLQDGKKVESGWKEVFTTNEGRSNERLPFDQAVFEVEAKYKDQRDKDGYVLELKDVDKVRTKFDPMLADSYDKRGVDFARKVYAQPKLDGIRCIARADGLWTRSGKPIVSCPHIIEDLEPFFRDFPDVVLDGELYNDELKDDFNKITSLVRKTKPKREDLEECAELVQYHVYDAFDPNQPERTFLDRYVNFVSIFELTPVTKVPTSEVGSPEMLDQMYGTWLKAGYEGQMIRYDTPYENKRSKNLLKRKEFITEEFPVVEIEQGEGNWAGYIKIFYVEFEPGRVCGAGVRGDQATLKALFESRKKPDWATVRFFTPTPDGVPRFPVVIDWGYGERAD